MVVPPSPISRDSWVVSRDHGPWFDSGVVAVVVNVWYFQKSHGTGIWREVRNISTLDSYFVEVSQDVYTFKNSMEKNHL